MSQPRSAAAPSQQPADFLELEERQKSYGATLPTELGPLVDELSQRWYLTSVAKPVLVDLVSEFTVQELVAVDGDSMLSLCFGTAEAFTPNFEELGFQPLTIVYLVEQFLYRLRIARLNFTLVWFEDRAVTSSLGGRTTASRRFARELVRRHLSEQCKVDQNTFPSVCSEEWQSWRALKRPYAILASDGSQASGSSHDSKDVARASDLFAVAQHLAGSLSSSDETSGLSVVLMDQDMFDDHKLLCFLIETSPLVRHAIRLQQEGLTALQAKLSAESRSQAEQSSAASLPTAAASLEPTPAEQLAVIAASNAQAKTEHRAALLLQAVLLSALPLKDRALQDEAPVIERDAQDFLAGAYEVATSWLRSSEKGTVHADMLDARLYAFCTANAGSLLATLPAQLVERYDALSQAAGAPVIEAAGQKAATEAPGEQSNAARLLAYTPSASITLPELPTEATAASITEPTAFLPRITAASERTQVQASSPFAQYKRSGRDKIPRDAHGRILNRVQARRFKADQRYATWVAAYAQSLLGSAGLTRQVITEGPALRDTDDKKKGKAQAPKEKAAGGAKKLSKKEQIIAQNQARKSDKASASVERKLSYLLEELEIGPATSKFDGADEVMLAERRRSIAALAPYIASAASPEAGRDLLLLRVRLSVEGWVCACTIGQKQKCYDLVVSAFTDIGTILSATPAQGFNDHERALLCSCGQALRVLALQGVYGPSHAGLEKVWDEVEEKKGKPKKGEFPFDVNWPKASKKYSVGDALDFQLQHCGDVMERQLDSKEDKRVATFKPDGWQRQVLDAVDARDSVLVVAPTSAGKTFIGFYCIEKALRESSDAVVVYVAPTKALVNQIAAELEARYTKNFGATERTIWAISAGDFDIHNPLKCQVLVASPAVLHKMCMQGDVAGSWLPRVRAVIMDEIHSLTDMELSSVWQQLLAIVPCPIVALSATVGNVDEFGQWLGKVRAQQGQKLTVVQHGTRYSDLKKHIYLPSNTESAAFKGITKHNGQEVFKPLHPFTALRPAGSVMPSDLELTPGEQLQLIRALQQTAAPDRGYPLAENLDPTAFFADVIGPLKRADTIKYQAALREAVLGWMSRDDSRAPGSPFLKLLDLLEGGLTAGIAKADKASTGTTSHIGFHQSHLLPLLSAMHQQALLPALMFNFSRDNVETLGSHLVEQLATQEAQYKATNKHWKAKVEEWEQWQADEPARRKAEERKLKAIKGREEAEALKKDARATDSGWQASFDPEAPLADYTFANEKCGLALEDIVVDVEKLNVEQWMKDGLIRGVAIHHTGLPNFYRQIVERWFRKGWLRVVICTGSLALGINMPARTSVFIGDHLELNALQYRQAAGRAGRRGMDLSGNVLFFGIPLPKIHRLLTSGLPSLDCDYPSSATFNLRLHSLMTDQASKKIGEKMAQAVVTLAKPTSRSQELELGHQFRASVEFLRRFGLLSAEGQPLALTGLATHLAMSEPSNLAFVELLRSGSFYHIASNAQTDRIQAVEDMVTTLSHLFASRKVNPTSRSASATDVLPPLPAEVRAVLEKLNGQAKKAFVDYASAVAHSQGAAEVETLPLSKVQVGGVDETLRQALPVVATHPLIRSSFAAVSGGSDDFSDLTWDAASTVRAGLAVTPSIVPSFDRILSKSPKNSYILDFFRQGNLDALVKVNGLPGKAQAWASLNDFWNVLLSLRAALEILLKTAAKGRAGRDGASSEADSLDVDALGGGADFHYDEDGDVDLGPDDVRTDSGIAGSQMGASSVGVAKGGPQLHVAGEVRTRSGKKVDPIPPPIELPIQGRHPQLWAVYELLVDIQRTYHARFFKTFA